MRKLTVVATVFLALIIASSFAFAEAGKSNIRFGLQYVSPTGDLKVTDTGTETIVDPPGELVFDYEDKLEADSAIGLFFGYEYMFTDMIGLDFGLGYSKHDVDDTFCYTETFTPEVGEPEIIDESGKETIGDVSMMPLTVGVNFHMSKSDKVDFYAGPFIGYVMYGDLSAKEADMEDIKLKSDFGYGVTFGLDVPFGGKGWMFSTALKYLSTKAEIDEEGVDEALDVNPWILQIGVGYTF